MKETLAETIMWNFLSRNNFFGITPPGAALCGVTAKQILHALNPLRFLVSRLNPRSKGKDIRRVCEAFQTARREFKREFGIDILKWKRDVGELQIEIQFNRLEKEVRHVLLLQRGKDKKAPAARKLLGNRYAVAAQFLQLSSWNALVASVEHELELEQV